MPRTALMMRMTGKHHASRRTLPATGTPIGTDLLRLWARVSRAGRCHYHLVPAPAFERARALPDAGHGSEQDRDLIAERERQEDEPTEQI
jgi:hypothetical protein